MGESYCGIGLVNPQNPTNVGAVMRAAGCFAADEVYYTGTRYNVAKKFHTDTQRATNKIYLECVTSLEESVPRDTKIVCVELAEGAQPLVNFVHPERACYWFGPEDGTLEQSLVNIADDVVFVPTVGCLNLAASVNVVLYDRFAKRNKQQMHLFGDELVINSRDQNNRLKVSRTTNLQGS